MSTHPYSTINKKFTPINQPILGEKQVLNSDGGYVYELSPFKTLERFLILGTEGGTYYVGEAKLTREAAENTLKAIELDGKRAVDLIVDISDKGRALKNDPAIFALALAASTQSPETRAYALSKLSKVCRIPTHLFHFVTYVKGFRGFGRGLKRALASWYNDQDVERLAYEVVKYQSRDGWANSDLLRLSHPKTFDPIRNYLYKWVVDGFDAAIEAGQKDPRFRVGDHILPNIVPAFEEAKKANIDQLLGLIEGFNLSREMLPTESLVNPKVWEALLPKMPLTAMLRNLGNLGKCGLLKPLSDASRLVVTKLGDRDSLKKARVHPIAILIALKVYESGQGVRGNGTWTPVPAVIDALNDAFYKAFDFIEPTGKRFLFGVDVSGSMSSPMMNLPISCAEGAAVMAMACAKVESNYYIMGFAHNFKDLKITPNMRLTDALRRVQDNNFGSTNCSLPMDWALTNKIGVDCFVVITDNEVNTGRHHPKQALESYRKSMSIHSKQVVMGMTSTGFTIANPKDSCTLDLVGFDASVPQALQEFNRI